MRHGRIGASEMNGALKDRERPRRKLAPPRAGTVSIERIRLCRRMWPPTVDTKMGLRMRRRYSLALSTYLQLERGIARERAGRQAGHLGPPGSQPALTPHHVPDWCHGDLLSSCSAGMVERPVFPTPLPRPIVD